MCVFFFPPTPLAAMLSEDNHVELESDGLPSLQWYKLAARENEKTKVVFKRYSQVSASVLEIQSSVVVSSSVL